MQLEPERKPIKMNNKTDTANKPNSFKRFINKYLNGSGLFPTVLALILMIILQCIVIGVNEGSIAGMFSKIWLSWLNIFRNNAYTGIIALGMCFVIVSGGIDLSVGSMMCAVGAALMYFIEPSSGLLAAIGITGIPAYIIGIVAALLIGFCFGEINGALIAYGRIPPFIVTLGTMKIFRSVTQQLTKQFNPEVPSAFKEIATLRMGGQVFLPIVYWVVIAILMYFLFKKTAFGKETIAVGSNEKAARYSGINVNAIKRRVYALSGLMCAVAAIIYVARIGSMDFANAGSGFEMDAIAGVVVGGTAMSGGKGNIVGSFLGMLIICCMNSILNMLGVPTFLCDAVRGAIIIVAVFVQRRNKTND